MAYQEWQKRLKELSDKVNIDQLATLLKLDEWDDVSEHNSDYIYEAAGSVEEASGEEAHLKRQEKVADEVYDTWHNAVESVANEIFDQHNLELQPIAPRRRGMPTYEYRIVPRVSWEDAASKIIDTINGVGMFEFASVREFMESGPYTVRQAVLSHLGHMKRRPDVYGTDSPRRLYERAWR